ncbi:MAG: Eco57I restriction-modification methylase domain-containing protein, partial [Planktothrix sp.]
MLRSHIEQLNRESQDKLNLLLLDEFSSRLGIKYQEVQISGKPKKRVLKIDDIAALKPFHWGYHFDRVLQRGGFDVIIANPPWEIFKPNAREFFAQYSDLVTRKKMDIQAFDKEQKKLLQDPEIANAWLAYQNQFPHVNLYYRTSSQYLNQISIVNGKKAKTTDINLYKLFLEQCFNLLRPGGECGIVIPSGIYTDLGSKQLREMLFNKTKVTGLFGLENRRAIFEGVHSSFKIAIITFEKGYKTIQFPAVFMRHDINEIRQFPSPDTSIITLKFLRKLSPDSLSIIEIKNDFDIKIAEKMLNFPMLGEKVESKWNFVLGREFHMTDDKNLFQNKSSGLLPLYEGKMIHQFTHLYAEPRYWVDEEEGREALLGKKGTDNGQELDYECYRFAYRAIARSTDSRTLIGTVLPSKVFCGNSLNI